MGVDLFFVLSGFLITFHLHRRWRRQDSGRQLRRYLSKRVLRTFPAYYAFLLVVVLGLIPQTSVDPENLPWRTVYHLLYLQDYLGSDIVVAFWSLGVEEKFYLAAPFLVLPLLGAGLRWRYAVLGGLFLVPPALRAIEYLTSPAPWTYEAYFLALRSPFHMSFEGLIAGCACAFLYLDGQDLDASRRRFYGRRLTWIGSLILGILILPAALLETPTFATAVLVTNFLALGFAAVLLGLLYHPGRLGRWLGARWLLYVSILSYSLYLVHMPFMENTHGWLQTLPGFSAWGLQQQLVVYLPVFGLISLGAALALHYLVEKPFLLVKDRI